MTGAPDPRNADESALALGRLARVLDGSTSRAEDLAARGRFIVAVGARPRGRLRWMLAATVVLACALVAVVLFSRSASLEYRITGPLLTQGEWLAVAPNARAVTLEFSEGTQIELGPGTKGRVAEVSSHGARVILGTGLIHARVVPRPRARWVVAAGPYLIEVTGTAFDVGWSTAGERLELSLHDGSVIVRGPSLRDGIRVAAGQRLTASARTGGVALSSLFAPQEAAAPATSKPAVSGAGDKELAPPAPRATPSWSELVAAGDFRSVLEEAQAKGFEQSLSHGSLNDLVALSDAARYLGNQGLARRGLLAQRSRFQGSRAAQAAAFMLGRMADDAGSSSEALRYYDTYASEAPNGSFAAEALGRKLVVLVRKKDVETARSVAAGYVKRFPRGAHAAYARELLARP